MIEKVALTIDGVKIRASKCMSVLDTAIEYGICIPHLCHYPDLTDLGACRLCIVEHHVGERVKVTTSCTLRVAEGMVIRTDTEKIQRFRKNIAELLVAQAPNSKAMQDMAVRCGVKEVRYPFRHDDCVLCGRCVRASQCEGEKNGFGFIGRGINTRIGVNGENLAQTDTSIDDKAVAYETCPVGCIIQKGRGFFAPIGERKFDKTQIGADIETRKRA